MVELSSIKALILDIDGILYEGDHARPGAVELIADLNEHNTPYVLLSNNSTNTFEIHVDKLSRLGIDIPPSSILTAAMVSANIIAREAKLGTRCFVIGEAGLMQALQRVGMEPTQDDDRDIRYVVIGMDRQLTYEKLRIATQAIRDGAAFISSNPDPLYISANGIIPASGAIQAALESATGVKARVTGKPEPPGFQLALEHLQCEASETGILGDQLVTDILGAARLGIKTFLIKSSLTGAVSLQDTQVEPDAVFDDMLDFYRQWVKRSK